MIHLMLYAATVLNAAACPLHFSLPLGGPAPQLPALPTVSRENVVRLAFETIRFFRGPLPHQSILAALHSPMGTIQPLSLQPVDEIDCERDSTIAVALDGRWLAIGGKELRMMELATKRIAWTAPNSHPFRFSADGRMLCVHQVGQFAALDASSGKELYKLPRAQCLDISRDAKRLAFFLPSNQRRVPNEIAIWDVEKKEFVGRRKVPPEVDGFVRFTFASNGTWGLATGNDYRVGVTSSNSHQYALQVPSLDTLTKGMCELPNGHKTGSSSIDGQLMPENSERFVVWGEFGIREVERTDKRIRLDYRSFVNDLPLTSRKEINACTGLSPDRRLAIIATRDPAAYKESPFRLMETATGKTIAHLESGFGEQYHFVDGGKLILRKHTRVVGKKEEKDVWRMSVQIFRLP